MANLTRQACQKNPEVRNIALDLATGLGVRGIFDAARNIVNYARTHFILVDEAEELLIDPLEQFRQIADRGIVRGDCDDISMLVGCLTYCLGYQTRFKAINQGVDGTFQHVFTEIFIPELFDWLALDPTLSESQDLIYESNDCITENL